MTKPFAVIPDDPEISTCWDCGHTWRRGTDGHHSCVQVLQEKLAEERSRIRRELLTGLDELRFELPRYVEGQSGSRIPTGMSTRMVLDDEDVRAALNRICPEEK